MNKQILRCPKCLKFTFKKTCCKTKTLSTKPAKYSPDDKWGKWRRIHKKETTS